VAIGSVGRKWKTAKGVLLLKDGRVIAYPREFQERKIKGSVQLVGVQLLI